MFNDRRPFGLKLVMTFAIINALATVGHFILIGQGIIKTTGIMGPVWVTAAAVILAGVLPTVLGIYGLYLKRLWGLSFFVFGCGAFLSMALLVLLTSLNGSASGIMYFISIYLIVYNLIAPLYSWSLKHHFREF